MDVNSYKQSSPHSLAQVDLESLRCVGCSKIATNASEVSCCISLLCEKCSAKFQMNKVCPMCNNDQNCELRPSYCVRRIISSITVVCPKSCGISLLLSNMDSHLNDEHTSI
jgi:hypothetical protein